MNARFERFCAYSLQRLKEPTTWSGITTMLTGLGLVIAPEKAAAIGMLGSTVAGLLLTFAREGANTPQNPGLPNVLTGQTPEPKPPIVPEPPKPVDVVVVLPPSDPPQP